MSEKQIRTRGNSIAGMGRVTVVKGGSTILISTESGIQIRVPVGPFSFLESPGEIVPFAITIFSTTLEDANPSGLILPPKLDIN